MTEIIGCFIQCVDYRRAVVAVLYHLENPENQTVLVRGRWIRLGCPISSPFIMGNTTLAKAVSVSISLFILVLSKSFYWLAAPAALDGFASESPGCEPGCF